MPLQGFFGVAAGFNYCSPVEVLRLSQALSRKSIRLYLMESAYVRDCGANIIVLQPSQEATWKHI